MDQVYTGQAGSTMQCKSFEHSFCWYTGFISSICTGL